MKTLVLLVFAFVLCETTLVAQNPAPLPVAIEIIQPTQPPKAAEAAPSKPGVAGEAVSAAQATGKNKETASNKGSVKA